ncbi:MAG: formylglycine-generating enzyme family protein [Deltaproteobacteria bacterium]|nr:formylglycine-generating enzyme family protein [Deltaproteobacteria bacterium]
MTKNIKYRSFGHLISFGLLGAFLFLANSASWAAEVIPSQVAKELGLEFVFVEPGEFLMGADPRLERFTSYALPKHEVVISNPFYLGKFEVTQKQWLAVMDRNPSRFKAPDHPVDSVSWEKAQEFVDKLNAKEGRQIFRLPTEAEWEYAARAGTDMVFPFANAALVLGDYAWFTNNSGLSTHPVGQKKPNPWGFHDLLGNVREWTSDWMAPYSDQKAIDPKGPAKGQDRVARGGAFNFIDVNCAVSRRVGYAPNSRHNFLGLRLVMDLEAAKEPKDPPTEPVEGAKDKLDLNKAALKPAEAQSTESTLLNSSTEPKSAEPLASDQSNG